MSNLNMSNLNMANSSCHTDELRYMNSDGYFKTSHNHTGSIPVISDMVKKVSNDYNSSSSDRSGFVGDQNESSMVKTKVQKKIRKPKFAFRTRSQVDVLDDGYRWRKYGQKAVKNDKFPRSYYKCTHQGCKVKKQVQRQSEDESIVITTYEDVHSHPIQKPSENFEQILSQMQYLPPFHL